MTEVRIPQITRQSLRDGPGTVYISGTSRQVLRDGPGGVRVAQLAREVLSDGGGPLRLAQLSRQALHAGSDAVRVAQVCRQVLRTVRDAPYPNFPVRLFAPPSLSARITGGAINGGTSASGEADLAAFDAGGSWVMEFGEAPLWDRGKVLAWRSFVSAADNGAMPVVVPLWDRAFQPFTASVYAGASTLGKVVWRDTAAWESVEIQAVAAADAERHARAIDFTFAGGLTLEGGEHFSIYGPRFGWRLYRLIRKTAEADGVQSWEIRPPLREWLGAGTGLDFDSPRCTMRAEGDLSEIVELLRFGRGTATFVESFSRYP